MLELFLIFEPSQVFINFAMGNISMENIPIHSEDESDNDDSTKAAQE